jgi:protein SCO1/2
MTRHHPRGSTLGLLALLALAGLPAAAQISSGGVGPSPGRAPYTRPSVNRDTETEAALKTVRLEPKLESQVPSDAAFRDEQGRDVRLADYLGRKPVALMLIQFECRMLCTEELAVLTRSLQEMRFRPGKEFNLLVVSIDPRETPQLARQRRDYWLAELGKPGVDAGYHFLTGTKENIDRLAEAIGFHYTYVKRDDEYAHPDGVILLTPQGKVARYFTRLDYAPRDLTFGLIEAARGKIGSPLEVIALLCFHYNPTTGKYGLALMNVLRLAGVATVVVLGLAVLLMRRRDARGRRSMGQAAIQGG